MAIERACFVTRVAALLTALRVGITVFFAAVFLLVAARRGDDFFAADFFALDFRAPVFLPEVFLALDFGAVDFFIADFLPAPDFFDARFGALLRALERFAVFFRAGDLRAEDFRALFFLAPPRDDFLAAAMLRAPM